MPVPRSSPATRAWRPSSPTATRRPSRAAASASAAATVDLPTPPLPVTTTIGWLRTSMRAHYGCEALMDSTRRPAYATCRRMQRRHDPTYFAATSLLPAAVRPAIHALYGFVRTADQIVDGPDRPATPQERRVALDAWERELERARVGEDAHPVPTALVDAGRRHDLPLDELRVYMTSMRVDCAPVRICDDAELDRYMNGSAAAVGR